MDIEKLKAAGFFSHFSDKYKFSLMGLVKGDKWQIDIDLLGDVPSVTLSVLVNNKWRTWLETSAKTIDDVLTLARLLGLSEVE